MIDTILKDYLKYADSFRQSGDNSIHIYYSLLMIRYGSLIRFFITEVPPVTQNACSGIPYHQEFEVFEELSEFYMDFEVI